MGGGGGIDSMLSGVFIMLGGGGGGGGKSTLSGVLLFVNAGLGVCRAGESRILLMWAICGVDWGEE